MTVLKTFIAALTLVAVAANPVAASLQSCCCTKKVQPERPCCQAAKKAKESAADSRACCATKRNAVASVQRAGCCCVSAPPAAAATQEQTAKRISNPLSVAVSGSSCDYIVPNPAVRRFEHLPGSFTLSGPPLLALYCTWLK